MTFVRAFVHFDLNGKQLIPAQSIVVDDAVNQRLSTEDIILGMSPTGSVLILKRGGKTATKHNGGRSFAKLVTGKTGARRFKNAPRYDYRLTAFDLSDKPVKAPKVTKPKSIIQQVVAPPVVVQPEPPQPQTKPLSVVDILKQRMSGNPIPASQLVSTVAPKVTLGQQATALSKGRLTPPMVQNVVSTSIPNTKCVWQPSVSLHVWYTDGMTVVGVATLAELARAYKYLSAFLRAQGSGAQGAILAKEGKLKIGSDTICRWAKEGISVYEYGETKRFDEAITDFIKDYHTQSQLAQTHIQQFLHSSSRQTKWDNIAKTAIAKAKKTSPATRAEAMEVRIKFPDGTELCGTPEAIAAYRKAATKK